MPLALITGVVAVAPASAQSTAPVAHASGGDAAPLVYPSLVRTRLHRAEHALKKAVRQYEAEVVP